MRKEINKLCQIMFFMLVMFSFIIKGEVAYADIATLKPTDDTFFDDLQGTSYNPPKGEDTLRGSIGDDYNCLPHIVNWVGNISGTFNNSKSAIRFDLSGINGTITGAELRIYVPESGKHFEQDPAITTFNLYSSNDDEWDETAVDLPATDILLQTFNTVTEKEWKAFDVTDFIKNEYEDNKIASFVLNSSPLDGNDIFAFCSDEDNTYVPQLVITYNPKEAFISEDSPMMETNLDDRWIDVALIEERFVDAVLDPANFILNNAPAGLTVESLDYIDNTHCRVNLAFDGTDFDSDISNLDITIKGAELSGGSDLTASNQLTITAINDPEVISISDDGNITEGKENGEKITVTLTGGTFANPINESNWTVTGLPTGVSKGAVTRINGTTVEITLMGNSTVDYDININNVEVMCTTAEYKDSVGGTSLSANSGVTLIANNAPTVTTNETVNSITPTSAIVSGNVASDGGATIAARGIEYKKHGDPDSNYTAVAEGGTAVGAYSVNLTGLEPSTSYDVRAYATNDEGTSYGSVVNFTTTNANPTISNITDILTDEDTAISNIAFTIGDAENPANSLVVSAFSDNEALIPSTGYVYGGSGANRTLTITPALNQYGDATVTVIVSDGNGGTAQETFILTVNPVNDAPVLTVSAPTLTGITSDQINNPGQTVASFIGTSISDVDLGALKGIAITSASGNKGTWEYSIDGGSMWTSVGAVTENSALLLRDTDRIRFVPNGESSATEFISYRA